MFPSNSLYHAIEKLIFCGKGVDEKYIKELKAKSENENTNNNTITYANLCASNPHIQFHSLFRS